jgi:peptide/nickel transport system ATP-binding protein
MPLLEVNGLTVRYRPATSDGIDGRGVRAAVANVSFAVEAGEVVGVSGPSGCGKTSTALAIVGILPPAAEVAGSVVFDGRSILGASEGVLRGIRGARVSLIYQEPALALNPVLTVGAQIAEVLRAHGRADGRSVREQTLATLREVGFGDRSEHIADSYPHQLSGGQRQRVLIAQAIVCRPRLVIADEPTASLDPVARHEILHLIRTLATRHGTAFLLISHSAHVLGTAADRVIRLPDARVVSPPTPNPAILDAWRATAIDAAARAIAASAPPLVHARGVRRTYYPGRRWLSSAEGVQALRGVDLDVRPGSTLGLAGESGCGKSTLARCLAGLERPDAGEIWIASVDITRLRGSRLIPHRNAVQLIFQDSAAAMNPRLSAADIIAEPLLIQRRGTPAERRQRALQLMESVGLPAERGNARPGEFSGGERQRLALARALAVEPRLLILDEAFSGLDVGTRLRMVALLRDLQAARGVAYLCISHDAEWLEQVAPEVAVMSGGRLVERRSTSPAPVQSSAPHAAPAQPCDPQIAAVG